MTEINVDAPYKYTIPISKAFVGEDGKPRLVGAATGPEIDLEDQRVSKSLIEKWVRQINNREIEVVYDDWHKKTEESITAELGTIEKAWTDDSDHMWVQVLLDEDNPVAQYIHKSAQKGKQYGMSIFGKATRFVDEVVSGRRVRTIVDGTLTRIAHTTRPIWTPSFGTVLSKAVDSVLESAEGDKSVSDDNKTPETPGVENPAEVKTTDAGAATAPDTGTAPAESTASAETKPEDGEAGVEKAISADTKKDAKALAKIVSTYTALGQQLREAGLLSEETEEGKANDTTVEKAAAPEDDRYATLEKSISTLTAAVATIADRIPDGSGPGSLRKSEATDPLAELRAVEDPMERFRLAAAALHGDGGGTR